MDDLSFQQMREFIGMANNLIADPELISEAVISEADTASEIDEPSLHIIFEDLQNVVFKLRSFTESREGDIGLGIELGMQRAADMIENVINRHTAAGE